MVLDRKFSQEYSINAADLQGSILAPIFFLLHIIDLPDDIICNLAVYADDTNLIILKCDQPSDLWQ